MRVISFITDGFSRLGDAIARRVQAEQERERAKERAEFESGLHNQLELVPKRDKAHEIFANNRLSALTVEPTSLKGHLYISGEVPVTDYKKYRDVLNKVLDAIGHELSPCINPETLSNGKVKISQFLRAVGT